MKAAVARANWNYFTVFGARRNAVVQMLSIPAYPFWSLAVFALALLAMYGLVAYGRNP